MLSSQGARWLCYLSGHFSLFSRRPKLVYIRYAAFSPHALWDCISYLNQCRVGDKLMIRVGGDFHYAPSEGRELTDLLLIGGGVGINPLFSMLSHHVRLLSRSHSNTVGKGSVRMLYSSKTESELLFRVCCHWWFSVWRISALHSPRIELNNTPRNKTESKFNILSQQTTKFLIYQ